MFGFGRVDGPSPVAMEPNVEGSPGSHSVVNGTGVSHVGRSAWYQGISGFEGSRPSSGVGSTLR